MFCFVLLSPPHNPHFKYRSSEFIKQAANNKMYKPTRRAEIPARRFAQIKSIVPVIRITSVLVTPPFLLNASDQWGRAAPVVEHLRTLDRTIPSGFRGLLHSAKAKQG
jgi:hypothetical protein